MVATASIPINCAMIYSEATALWAFPASAPLVGNPHFSLLGETCLVEFSLQVAEGRSEAVSLLFDRVASYRCTLRPALSPRVIEAFHGRLTEIMGSAWKDEVLAALMENGTPPPSPLRHLAICFEEGPGYEFICGGFEARLRP
jgi:hypothetical protein